MMVTRAEWTLLGVKDRPRSSDDETREGGSLGLV